MATFSNLSDADYKSAIDGIKTKKDAVALAKKLGFSDKGSGKILSQSECEYAGGIIYAQAQQGPIDKLINNSITLSGLANGQDNFLVTFQNSISQALIPVAYCIAMIFFILALVDLGMSERMNLDSFTKFFARLAVGIFMIDNCANFLTLGNAIADWMGQLIANNGTLGYGDGAAKNMFNSINSIMPDSGFQRLINSTITSLFAGLQVVPLLFILTTLLSRLMEICIRGALMPIAFSFVTEEGWRGTAIRYLKRYIALLAMGPLIQVVFSAGNWINGGISAWMIKEQAVGGFFTSILTGVAVGFAEVGIIKKLQSVVSEAFGA